MRLIRMFGLAAIAVVAAMAFVGASSATASTTALCKLNQTPCQAANLATHVHLLDSNAKLLTDTITVECHALFLGGVLGLVENGPVLIHGEFTYTGCNNSCTAEDLEGGLILILKTATNLAEVKGDGFKVRVLCVGVINCEYSGSNLVGHGVGANLPETKGKVVVHEQTVNKVGGITEILCPAKAKLDALFESLDDIWITT